MRERQRAPNAPADLSAEGRRLFLDTIRQLRQQGTWAEGDTPLVESYTRAVCLARSARRLADAEPIVAGSRGQPVANPLLKVAAESEARAMKYASELVLTPASRRKHGIEVKTDDAESFLASLGN